MLFICHWSCFNHRHLPLVAEGLMARVFGRLIAASTSLHPLGDQLCTRSRGEMGGLNEECKKKKKKKKKTR
jgi:hypothetical protein